MAGSGQPANVQAYLDNHKISTLFEDLTSLLVKNLPSNPIEFLITKLEDRNKKKVSARPATSTTSVKRPIGTGIKTGVTSSAKGKPTATTSSTAKTTGKASSTSTTSRSTSSTRVGGTTRTVSKTEPAKRPTTGTSTRPGVTKTTTAPAKSTTAPAKPTTAPAKPTTRTSVATPSTKTTSRVPKSPGSNVGSKVGVVKKPTTGATGKSTILKTKTAADSGAKNTIKSSKEPPKRKVKPEPTTSSSSIEPPVPKEEPNDEDKQSSIVSDDQLTASITSTTDDVQPPTATGSVDESSNAPSTTKEEKKLPDTDPTTVEEPPPSQEVKEDTQTKMEDKKEDNEEETVDEDTRDDSIHDDKEQPIEEDNDEDEHDDEMQADSGTTLDVEELMKLKRAKKLAKQGITDKSHLTNLLAANTDDKVGVVTHDDDEAEESEDEGLEVVESHEMLEEEGVVLSEEARRMSMKLPETAPQVELTVIVCARCAKIINADEESVVVSSTKLSSYMDPGFDDSASQVIGTQVPFPQWDGTSSIGSESQLSLKQKWAMTGQSATPSMVSEAEEKSELTAQTLKTVSDEESELKLPTPIDYVKPDDEDTVTSVNED